MLSLWRACSVLVCACAVAAQRIDQESMMSPRTPRPHDRGELAKVDEPTCDQLKAMWRFSKRQARAPEIMNEVSSYRDPLMYNEWPVYTAVPRTVPRFRYSLPPLAREAYGRVVTKAPPNAVRAREYEEMQMYGTLNVPHASGKILRYSGPSRPRGGPAFIVPPQRNKFDVLRNMIQQEHVRDLQRMYEAEQKQEMKDLTNGRSDEYAYGTYGEQESRGFKPVQLEYPADEPNARHNKKPPSGSRQVSQFSRYSDVMLPPARRTVLHPYFDYALPEYVPYY